MPINDVMRLACVSHGCIVWEGRHLDADECEAISRAHALQHSVTPITVEKLLGQENNPDAQHD